MVDIVGQRPLLLINVLFVFFFAPLPAMSWEYRGNTSLETRVYAIDRDKERRSEQIIHHVDVQFKKNLSENLALTFHPEIYWEMTESRIRRFEPLEGYVDYRADAWDLRLGQAVESWAITDTFNPVDILNRRDLERDLMRSPKLGEAMLRFRCFLPEGETLFNQMLNLYVLPWFRESRFPKKDDPYSFERVGLQVRDKEGIKPTGLHQMGFAARYGASWESLDFFLLTYHGVTRNPIFQAEAHPGGILLFRPVYYPADTVGGGFQWALGDWLLKLELARTWNHRKHLGGGLDPDTRIPQPFTQYVMGFDRSLYGIGLVNSTLTWTLEFSGEDRTRNTPGEYRPFKSDVFTQFHYEFGNLSQMVLSLNLAYDIRIGESITNVLFEWKPFRDLEGLKLIVEGEYQRAATNHEDSFLRFFPDNSFVSITTVWSF